MIMKCRVKLRRTGDCRQGVGVEVREAKEPGPLQRCSQNKTYIHKCTHTCRYQYIHAYKYTCIHVYMHAEVPVIDADRDDEAEGRLFA